MNNNQALSNMSKPEANMSKPEANMSNIKPKITLSITGIEIVHKYNDTYDNTLSQTIGLSRRVEKPHTVEEADQLIKKCHESTLKDTKNMVKVNEKYSGHTWAYIFDDDSQLIRHYTEKDCYLGYSTASESGVLHGVSVLTYPGLNDYIASYIYNIEANFISYTPFGKKDYTTRGILSMGHITMGDKKKPINFTTGMEFLIRNTSGKNMKYLLPGYGVFKLVETTPILVPYTNSRGKHVHAEDCTHGLVVTINFLGSMFGSSSNGNMIQSYHKGKMTKNHTYASMTEVYDVLKKLQRVDLVNHINAIIQSTGSFIDVIQEYHKNPTWFSDIVSLNINNVANVRLQENKEFIAKYCHTLIS